MAATYGRKARAAAKAVNSSSVSPACRYHRLFRLFPTEPKPAEGSLRILVVDDNHDAAQSLSMLLTSKGHTVWLAHDGYEALEVALAERPQVVLLDIGLPGMDGYAVARALRQHPDAKMTHLIALSGYGRPEDREQAKTAGFNGYLVKPVNFDELQCALNPAIISLQEAF